MGEKNSSLTRVQPIMNALLDSWPDGEPWLQELWNMAVLTRPGVAIPPPASMGKLLSDQAPASATQRLGKVFERTVAPPAAFLRWLLENPQKMQVRDPVTFGAKSDEARTWRAKLFSGDRRLVSEAQAEGLKQLGQRLAQRGRNKWWAFEGFSHIDCCLMTETCVLFIEGKRTEAVSPSTFWFGQRSQLWRNVEAAEEFAQGKDFGVMLAVEYDEQGTGALKAAQDTLEASFPHLTPQHRADLSTHFLGFVTWPEVVTRFGLPPHCMPETVP
jgi:hypothetical protein